MATVKEYECKAHGFFESADPTCPKGCKGNAVTRVFLTAPSVGSAATKFADRTFRGVADRYKLSDMSNKDGRSVMANYHAKHGNNSSFTAPIGEQGIAAAIAAAGGRQDNALKDVGKPEAMNRRTQLMAPNWGKIGGE